MEESGVITETTKRRYTFDCGQIVKFPDDSIGVVTSGGYLGNDLRIRSQDGYVYTISARKVKKYTPEAQIEKDLLRLMAWHECPLAKGVEIKGDKITYAVGGERCAHCAQAAPRESGVSILDTLEKLSDEHHVWSRETFGDRDFRVDLNKLIAEAEEAKDTGEPIEFADIMLCFVNAMKLRGIDFIELISLMREKMEINKKRTWKKNPDGTFSHVKS